MNFTNFLLSQGKSSTTIKQYVWCMGVFFKWLENQNTTLEDSTAKDIVAYLGYMQRKGVSNTTRNLRLLVLHLFFDYQIAEELRVDHPSRHIKLQGVQSKKLYPVLNREQLEKLYTSYEIPTHTHPKSSQNWFANYVLSKRRNKAIIGLLIYQGITTAEVRDLKVSDLELRAGKIRITGAREGTERTLDLNPAQIIDLMEYQLQIRAEIEKQYTQTSNVLFLSLPKHMGGRAKDAKLQIWSKLGEELREKNPYLMHFNQLRTSVIVHWLKIYNLRQVQQMAGHRSVSSTEKYLVYHTADLQVDVDKFHPMG